MQFGLFGLLFPDCVPPYTATDDTGEVFRTVVISAINYSCGPEGWEYRFEAVGDAFDGDLTVYDIENDALAYEEFHPMPNAEWEDSVFVYTLSLDAVASEDDVIPGETTFFPCPSNASVIPEMNWYLEVSDSNGDFGDCAIFGKDLGLMPQRGCSEWSYE
jgi:hypothetical protein